MDAKIGDFGLTREGPGCEDTHVKVSSVHGTECYLPSEYLRHRHLSPQVDIFSYGIVLLEIATGLRPFDPKRLEGKRLVCELTC
nr:serine/threonine-protein kinase pelle-like [Parasteatoda tepidariorum]